MTIKQALEIYWSQINDDDNSTIFTEYDAIDNMNDYTKDDLRRIWKCWEEM